MKIITKNKTAFIFFSLTLSPVAWLLISTKSELKTTSIIYLCTGILFNTVIQFILINTILNKFFIKNKFFIEKIILSIVILINFRFNVLNLIIASTNQKIITILFFLIITIISLNKNSGFKFSLIFSIIILIQPIIKNINNTTSEIKIEQKFSFSIAKKRNIYFLGLDALPNEEYYKKYFYETPIWKNQFANNGFRRINNAHTGGATTTRGFYINLLTFKKTEYSLNNLDILNRPLQFHYLMKSIGYRSQFMFHNYLLGSGKNNFFNYNYPINEKDSNFCPFATGDVGFYLCQEKFSKFIYILLQGKFPSINDFRSNKDPSIDEMMPILLDRIKLSANDSNAWVSIFHLWEPGHTQADYRHYNLKQKSEFQRFFQEKSIEATQDALKIIGQIKKYDPSAVIVISGDHGPHLSQGWNFDPFIKNIFSDEEQFDDTQGIGMYIYPSDFCLNEIHDGYNSTTLFIDIFKCLSK